MKKLYLHFIMYFGLSVLLMYAGTHSITLLVDARCKLEFLYGLMIAGIPLALYLLTHQVVEVLIVIKLEKHKKKLLLENKETKPNGN